MKKLCPLRKYTYKVNNSDSEDNLRILEEFSDCKLTSCAWYDDDEKECAIKAISGIADIMHEMSMNMRSQNIIVEE